MKSIIKTVLMMVLCVFALLFVFISVTGFLLQLPNKQAMCNFNKVEIGMSKEQVIQFLGTPKNGEPTKISIFSYDTYVIDGTDTSVSFDANDNVYSKSCPDYESCSPKQYICYFVH